MAEGAAGPNETRHYKHHQLLKKSNENLQQRERESREREGEC